MLNRFSQLILISVIVFSGFFSYADEDKDQKAGEVQEVTEEVKKSESEVQTVTAEIKITNETTPQVSSQIPSQKTEQEEHKEVGDVKVYNYGIQAIFINSDVTVNGGTIHGEMIKGEGAPPSKEEQKPEKPSRQPPSGKPGKKPEKPSKFDETIKDATKHEGLFTVYTMKDKVFWEVPPSKLGQDLLLSAVLATGAGAGRTKPGTFVGSTYMDSIIFRFETVNGKIQLLQQNLRFTSDNPQEQESIEKNYGDSIIASFPIDVTNPETSGYLLEMSKFFLTDFFELGKDLSMSVGGGYGLDRSNSYIEESKAFPKNVVTRINYAFRSGSKTGTIAVPDSRSIQLKLMTDIRLLQKDPEFTSRKADQRIGHFVEAHIDFSNDERRTQFVRNITRWNIKKASPELELSPPEKPVVFWIENTVPEKYRESIRDGILEWNKAFRKIGIKDPLVVKYQPEDADWDISDARYNTIHWNTSHNMAYGAVAQYVANPLTGQIMNGGFLIESENIRGLLNLRRINEPDRIEMLRKSLNSKPSINPQKHVCEYAKGLTDHAIYALTMMAAQEGIHRVTDEFINDFVNQYLFSLACHEFGHVLGFRHNFEGSTMLPLDQLHDKKITSEKSIVSSVMEYAPVNFAPEGVEQGHYFPPTIGPYDYLAIEYAYKDIQPATGETIEDHLDKIAGKAEKPIFAYGTDEDIISIYGPGIDPMCNTYDLGDNPLAFGKQQTQMVMDTIPKLPNLVQEGDDYTMVRLGFNRMLGYYFDSVRFALKYLGGQYVRRVKKGGLEDQLPLEPLSAVKQREALEFINDKLLSDEIFEFDPKILNMLAAEKWFHWGSTGMGTPSEYSVYMQVSNFYDLILYRLYSPLTIRRIIDAENQRRPEEVSFTVPELFRTMNNGIWREVKTAEASEIKENSFSNKNPFISTYRRSLQRQHLKRLIEIMLEPPFNMPEDARTQAWLSLKQLKNSIEKIVQIHEKNEVLDDYSYTHLAESLAKIDRALEARLSVGVDFW